MNGEFYHDKVRDYLIYALPEPTRLKLAQLIPGSKSLGGDYIAIQRTLHNCQLLVWLGIVVPPIMDKYDWPHNPMALPPDMKACPTEAQRAMSNFLVLNARSFNLSDMGTMKTLAALWSAEFIIQHYPPGTCRCLINTGNASLGTLQRVWGDALGNHFLGRRSWQIVHHANAERRREQLATPADFYIINPDGLKVGAQLRRKFVLNGLSLDLQNRTDIKIAIVDEASVYRDRRTGRHKVASVLYHPSRMPYLWPLTGTPTPNGPTDAYGLAKLVNDAFGESFTDFHRRTMVHLNKFKWVPARGSYQAAAKLLRPAIRIPIEDVWDGPSLTIQQRDVELSAEQHKTLSELKNQLSITLGGQQITPANEAGVRAKALQIVMGAVYDKHHDSHTVDAGPRYKDLVHLIDEATKKVLVFVPLTNVINLLCQQLTDDGFGVIKLNGEVTRKDRDSQIASFKNDETIRVAVADPQVVAHGINEFVAATTAIWYGPTDKTELWLQGNKRAHRPGQTFPVTIVQLVATALERGIWKRIVNNETLQGALLDWVKGDKL